MQVVEIAMRDTAAPRGSARALRTALLALTFGAA